MMTLIIPDDGLRLISASHQEIVLGIIMVDGTVRLRISDRNRYRGHDDWIREDKLDRDAIRRGFSFAVFGGHVQHVYGQSILNETGKGCSDFRLEDEWVEALESLLPLAENYVRDLLSDLP